MDIETLRIFREASRTRSFSETARRLDLDPSQVSRAIAGLERALSVRLFERSTRKIAPTEAGQSFFDRVAPLVDDLDEATEVARDLSHTPRGTLRVAASTAFGEVCILPMLPKFLEAHPEIDIDLQLGDRPVDLLATQTDIAVRLTPDAPPDTQISKLMDTSYRCVATPDWIRANPLAHPSDLSGIACPRFALPGFRDAWTFRTSGTRVDVPVGGRLQILGATAVRQMVLMGQGPSLLADWLIGPDIAMGRLQTLFPEWRASVGDIATAAWILTPSRHYRPLKTRRFIEALRKSLAPKASGEMIGD